MSIPSVQTPIRADHVGSLLRPKNLLDAREDFLCGGNFCRTIAGS